MGSTADPRVAAADEATLPSPLPLFPLPLVLFPGGLLPLKVFEARYLDMVGNCLREQQPFGVVCLREGEQVGRGPTRLERVGVLARILDVDSEQPGILKLQCIGTHRFRLQGTPVQRDDGLWVAPAEPIPDDEPLAPDAAMMPSVQALAQAAETLKEKGIEPFAVPLKLDDAGWVANRWCEILPISLAAKQKLMELEDAATRLVLIDEFLRSKQVVRG